MMKKVFLLWVFFQTQAAVCLAQQSVIHGRVRDINTHRDLQSVNIYLKGTAQGTESSVSGEFTLRVEEGQSGQMLVFRHIGYDVEEVPLDSMSVYRIVYMQPRVIPMQGLRVEAGDPIGIQRDLPEAVSLIRSDRFEGQGFTDAGDLLKTDHSVQVDEDLSGKKTVAIRGGNPDEVIVLYNHIPMNSLYDNQFNLSLVDLEDMERVEIIKGSNTTLYGSGSLSGIINVVPRVEQDYTVRFQQRIGTYRSGNWGLQFYRNFNGVYASYSYRKGKTLRQFADAPEPENGLENGMSQHLATLVFDFPRLRGEKSGNRLSAMFVRNTLNYENRRDVESITNANQVISLNYRGDIAWIKNLSLSSSYHKLDEREQFGPFSYVPYRDVRDRSFQLHADKRIFIRRVELFVGYEYTNAKLDFAEDREYPYVRPEQVNDRLARAQHGFMLISKYHAPTGYSFLSFFDFDASLRHDRVRDNREDLGEGDHDKPKPSSGEKTSHGWNETMFKCAAHLRGDRGDLLFNGYIGYGKNVRFPSLFQQISTPYVYAVPYETPTLEPEKTRSTEVGVELSQDLKKRKVFYGWLLSGNFFKNYYDNKFRMFYMPGIPVAFYDNVRMANNTGFECRTSLYFFKKKITLDLGFSRYFISDKSVFPFKCEIKGTLDMRFDHRGYAILCHIFMEGEQTGWIREYSGGFAEVTLPAHANVDIHFSKTVDLYSFKVMGNISVRNLFDEDVALSGLALWDRRVTLTFAIQY